MPRLTTATALLAVLCAAGLSATGCGSVNDANPKLAPGTTPDPRLKPAQLNPNAAKQSSTIESK